MRRALLVCGLIALVLPLAALADSPPVITVPADMTVEAQNFSGATVTYTASAVDNRGEPVQVTCNPPSGSVFGFGQTTVTCTARAHGESATKHLCTPEAPSPPASRPRSSRRSGRCRRVSASDNSGEVSLSSSRVCLDSRREGSDEIRERRPQVGPVGIRRTVCRAR